MVSCLERGANDLDMVQLMPLAPHQSLVLWKSRLVLPFWSWLIQVYLERRPLNGCLSVAMIRCCWSVVAYVQVARNSEVLAALPQTDVVHAQQSSTSGRSTCMTGHVLLSYRTISSTSDRSTSHVLLSFKRLLCDTTTTTTVLRPFVRDYPGEPVPEETLTHSPSWSSSSLYQLLPSTTIHSILPVQITGTCLAVFLHNLFPTSILKELD